MSGSASATTPMRVGAVQVAPPPCAWRRRGRRVSLEVVVDQVRDDLGVGLRLERVAQRLQARALLLVVLDDAVVHHRDLVRSRRAGGRWARSRRRAWPSACGRCRRCPSGPRRATAFSISATRPDAAHAPDAAVQDGDARRVVAAVLEALQALGEDGDDVTAGDGCRRFRTWASISAGWTVIFSRCAIEHVRCPVARRRTRALSTARTRAWFHAAPRRRACRRAGACRSAA